MPPDTAALPYHEPGIVTIFILSSFLLLLNTVNYALDRLIYCGLIGQIFIGIAWGLPGADWLADEIQATVMQLGYLGLMLIVFEDKEEQRLCHSSILADISLGGLSTNVKLLRENLLLSSTVALIGISAPIATSFALIPILQASALQAFAAGAALCSTSLGTIFTVPATSGLTESRLGIVLTSAAMMDDVVGLVMVQVISKLRRGSSSFDPITVVRPVLVSIAFATIIPLVCAYIGRPVVKKVHGWLNRAERTNTRAVLTSQAALFIIYTGILLGMVTGSTYAGSSNLFAAYLVGASITWLNGCTKTLDGHSTQAAGPRDKETSSSRKKDSSSYKAETDPTPDSKAVSSSQQHAQAHEPAYSTTGLAIYKKYYQPAVNLMLKPFFFASIGFSIPITQMFTDPIVWRGLVHAALMAFTKLICGAPLIRFDGVPSVGHAFKKLRPPTRKQNETPASEPTIKKSNETSQGLVSTPDGQATIPLTAASCSNRTSTNRPAANTSRKRVKTFKPRSFYQPFYLEVPWFRVVK